jgi:hypothetical protein
MAKKLEAAPIPASVPLAPSGHWALSPATRRVVSISDTVIQAGVYFLIVATPLAFGTVEPWSIAIAEVVIFAIALAWGLKMVTLGEIRIERTPLNLCWLLVLGLGVLQILPLPLQVIGILSPKAYTLYREMSFDAGLTASWRTLSLYPYATRLELVRLLSLALLFWVVANHFRTREQVDRLVRVIMAMGFLLAIFGIVQYFTWNGKLYWVRELTQGGNPFGPYVNRNHFAGYMEMVVPLTLGYVVSSTRSQFNVTSWRERLLRWGTPQASQSLLIIFVGLIMMTALLLSGSKAGLLSFLGSMVFFALFPSVGRFRSKRWWGLLALFLVLGFASTLWLKPDSALQPFAILWLGSDDPSAHSRLLVWQDTLRLGWDYRWSGTGLNTFSWAFPLYKRPLSGQYLYTHAENDYLQAFAEGGVSLAAILAGGLLLGGAQLLNGWTERQRSYERGLGLGLLAGLAALLIHSASDFNLHIPANAILFVLLLALGFRLLVFGCPRVLDEPHNEGPFR